MKFQLLLIVLVISVALIVPALAQDTQPTANCTDQAVADLISQLRTQTDAAESASNAVAAIEELEGMTTAISSLQAECAGMAFSGGDKKGEIIGVLTIPEGLYRVAITGGPNFSVETTITDGDCDMDGFFYLTSDGGESETLLESNGCSLLIQLDNADEDWTLAFQPLT